MSYAIQRRDAQYVAPRLGTLTPNPHEAYLFASREAAAQYITRFLNATWYRVATIPDTRPLLTAPTEKSA